MKPGGVKRSEEPCLCISLPWRCEGGRCIMPSPTVLPRARLSQLPGLSCCGGLFPTHSYFLSPTSFCLSACLQDTRAEQQEGYFYPFLDLEHLRSHSKRHQRFIFCTSKTLPHTLAVPSSGNAREGGGDARASHFRSSAHPLVGLFLLCCR